MTTRWMGRAVLGLGLLAAVAAWPSDRATVAVPSESGSMLWLPATTTSAERDRAVAETARFERTWRAFYGKSPALSDPLEVPASGSLGEALFSTLWRQASTALSPEDRPAALGALRWAVLDDLSPIHQVVARATASGRWASPLAEAAPVYAFLLEEGVDPAFAAEALPPGRDASRLRAALGQTGVPWNTFWNRYVAWLLRHALQWGMVSPSAGTLPAVWMLDGALAPGEMTAWRFPVPGPAAGIAMEVSGEVGPGLRLMHAFTDDAGHVSATGLCDLHLSPLILPRQERWLWVFLWNASPEESGRGVALTLWSDYRPPFGVLDSSHESGVLDLFLDEEGGIADYTLWAPQGGGSAAEVPAASFSSEGEGAHRYRLSLPPSDGSGGLRLTCRTLAGGTFSTGLVPRESGP